MSRWAHGTSPHELPEEQPRDQRAGLAGPADVLDVGDLGVDVLAVDVGQRQLPHRLAGAVGRHLEPVRATRRWLPSRRRYGDRGRRPARRSAWRGRRWRRARASTASDSPSASTRRPSASVLSTSIVLPLRASSTSPGLIALPPGMFSVVGMKPMTLAFTPSAGKYRHRRQHRGAAGHVGLHRHHPVGRLERQPARVERDALADERDGAGDRPRARRRAR